MKGQLPKAYLRIDPLIDSHPDWKAMVILIVWANRQPRRGYFKTLDTVKKLIGRKRLDACIARRDLAEQPDGTHYLVGWDDWQEGDFTVGERMRRYRNKHVTGPVTDAVTLPSPPSEAVRQQGSKASGTDSQPASAPAREDEPPPTPGTPAEARTKALAVIGPKVGYPDRAGQPGEAEAVRRELYEQLRLAHETTRMPMDALLAKCSRTSSGSVITNPEGCSSVPWMQVTTDRLRGMRLSATADAHQAAGPAPRGRPTVADVSRSVFGINDLTGERKS